MSEPKLVFFCELATQPLLELFADPQVIDLLKGLDAGVSLGLTDLSPERAEVVRRLNAAGVPVHAWLLLPEEEGYWFNRENAQQAASRFQEFLAWTNRNGLEWEWVGLDIEPDMAFMKALVHNPEQGIRQQIQKLTKRDQHQNSERIYQAIVEAIRSSGWKVESYQMPWIADERAAGSRLLQRAIGLVDISADREVLMLYSHFVRPVGAEMLQSYGQQAQAIGVGVTGGGSEVEVMMKIPPLSWEEFQRDLLIAARLSPWVYIFSLEGSVRQGFLERLPKFDWNQTVQVPQTLKFSIYRKLFQSLLWTTAHPWLVIAGCVGFLLGLIGIRQWINKNGRD